MGADLSAVHSRLTIYETTHRPNVVYGSKCVPASEYYAVLCGRAMQGVKGELSTALATQ
jgi:hypothetical protein